MNEKLQPSTIESHFRQKIIDHEKILTFSKVVTVLLDQYWKDFKDKVEVFFKDTIKNTLTTNKMMIIKLVLC